MNAVKIPTAVSASIETAAKIIPNQSLLYDCEESKVYIKFGNELQLINPLPDSDNFKKNLDGTISLKSDISLGSIKLTNSSDTYSPVRFENINIFSVSSTNYICPIICLDNVSNPKVCGGEIFGAGELVGFHYSFSVVTTAKSAESENVITLSSVKSKLNGVTSSGNEPKIIKATYSNKEFICIQFDSSYECSVYFTGSTNDSATISGNHSEYTTDTDFSDIISL